MTPFAFMLACGQLPEEPRVSEEPPTGDATVAPAAPSAAVEAEPAQATFQIGEPVWIDLRVVNRGTVPVSGSVLRGFGERNEWLFVDAVGPDGARCPDPFRYERVGFGGNAFASVKVPTGMTQTLRIDLTKYVWLDAPGVYDVTFVAPLDHRTPTKPPPDDPLWVHTRVQLVSPDDPEALARAILGSADDWRMSRSVGDPISDRNTFEAFGHTTYVPVLERLAMEGLTTSQAIAACPCVEATEALLRLYDRDPDPGGVVARELLRRIPGPALPNDWFVARVSSTDTSAAVAERARNALVTPTSDPAWGKAYDWGAEVIARVGAPSDGMLVLEALDRALATPDGADGRYGAVQMLGWAAHTHPAQTTGADDDAALFATIMQWDGRTGAPPPGWEDVVLRALASDDVAIVEHVMDRLPRDPSAALVAAVLPHVGSASWGVRMRLYRYFANHPPQASLVVGPLRRSLAGPPSERTVGILQVLKLYLPLDEWLDLLLPEISADPARSDLAILLLQALTGCRESGHHGVSASEGPSLVAAWQTVLRGQRAELHAGPLPIVPGGTSPALVPASFQCRLASGELWPAR